MKIACLQFNPIQENTYIIWDDSLEAVVIDAGNSNPRENAALDNFIAEQGLKVVMAANTHGHFDHTLGIAHVKERYGVPFALSSKDQFLLDNAQVSGRIFGVPVAEMPAPDIDLDTTSEIRFGNTALRVIHVPGHTPGHVAFFEPESKSLFTGDTLFRESIGRTDLPGGDYSWIMASILDNLIPLGEEVHVYPGHGPESTIGHEVLYNPFIVEVLNQEVNYKN
ncbi:MBL fold metallo-hydrolase [uncultured Alistipes sp.]|jgi:Zn-dependent hydrolases, including glyoxylases|uniref:MBL fold metallo-hydrolase n=1 Tax=uncultured Alistipes sp. TaxID=538949 RepID=UPI0025D05A63|nr:MBL fold metallo-hydrolase [uncultured Alistipes sp.]